MLRDYTLTHTVLIELNLRVLGGKNLHCGAHIQMLKASQSTARRECAVVACVSTGYNKIYVKFLTIYLEWYTYQDINDRIFILYRLYRIYYETLLENIDLYVAIYSLCLLHISISYDTERYIHG